MSGIDLNQFVPKYFRMNPETDDLLMDSYGLHEGMRILTGNVNARVDLSHVTKYEVSLESALKHNRWFVIEKIKTEPHNDLVMLIGRYDDGEKMRHIFSLSQTEWYVKKDTVKVPDSHDAEVRNQKNEILHAGTPEEIISWIEENPEPESVCYEIVHPQSGWRFGVVEYLYRHGKSTDEMFKNQ